jgi:hypothetical protein
MRAELAAAAASIWKSTFQPEMTSLPATSGQPTLCARTDILMTLGQPVADYHGFRDDCQAPIIYLRAEKGRGTLRWSFAPARIARPKPFVK